MGTLGMESDRWGRYRGARADRKVGAVVHLCTAQAPQAAFRGCVQVGNRALTHR